MDNGKQLPAPAAQQVFSAAAAVQPPPQDGGEGQQRHGNGQEYGGAAAVNGGEGGHGKLCPGILTVGHRHAGGEDYQGGHGTDHQGIGKYLKNAV